MKTKRAKYLAIIIIVLILVIVSAFTIFRKDIMYLYAVQNYKYENYSEASMAFDDLSDFKDSEQRFLQSSYMEALDLFSTKKYEEAKTIFAMLGDYESSEALVKEVDYVKAIELLNNDQLEQAKDIFIKLDGYENSVNYIKDCDYRIAIVLFANGEVDKAKTIFVSLGDYLDSLTYIKLINYDYANELLKSGNYSQAKIEFFALGDFKDSVKKYESLVIRNPKVGEYYQGGYIGYILKSGDPGYDPNVFHGLIVAKHSFQGNWVPSEENIKKIPGTSISLGSGMSNTKKIINHYGNLTKENAYAANFISQYYKEGGYTDWYLPSLGDLKAIYKNKYIIMGVDDFLLHDPDLYMTGYRKPKTYVPDGRTMGIFEVYQISSSSDYDDKQYWVFNRDKGNPEKNIKYVEGFLDSGEKVFGIVIDPYWPIRSF